MKRVSSILRRWPMIWNLLLYFLVPNAEYWQL